MLQTTRTRKTARAKVLTVAKLILPFGLLTLLLRYVPESGKTDAAASQGHAVTVFLCGYKFWRFCEAVFPEYSCKGSAHGFATDQDILLIGMHASCPREKEFPGKIIYINGEPDIASRVKGSYYLGPLDDGREQSSMQFYFASIAALQMPQAYAGFIERKRNSGEHFLLYVSRRCLPHREKAFNMFASIGPVTAAGKCTGSTVEGSAEVARNTLTIDGTGSWMDAHELYSRFKFGLVMENTERKGYVSEKILNAFSGGTVPIYFGTEDVFQIFNYKAFVYWDKKNPAKTLDEVAVLLQDTKKYKEMLSQPILAPGAYEFFFALYGKGQTSANVRQLIGISPHAIEEDD